VRKWPDRLLHLVGMETRDQAWQDGYETADRESEEVFERKDAYIERQTGIILDLMDVLTVSQVWEHVPVDLKNQLRDYV
jgi:hypothetical protein